jgi:hypothetical protein
MYGTGGMYPSYGYNQTPFGAILQSVVGTINAVQTGYNSTGGYFQPTFGDTYNQGTFSGQSGILVIGVIILLAIVILK